MSITHINYSVSFFRSDIRCLHSVLNYRIIHPNADEEIQFELNHDTNLSNHTIRYGFEHPTKYGIALRHMLGPLCTQ